MKAHQEFLGSGKVEQFQDLPLRLLGSLLTWQPRSYNVLTLEETHHGSRRTPVRSDPRLGQPAVEYRWQHGLQSVYGTRARSLERPRRTLSQSDAEALQRHSATLG